MAGQESTEPRAALLALLGGDPAPARAAIERDGAGVEALALRAELSRALAEVAAPTIEELDARLSAPASERPMLVRTSYALGMVAVARLDGAWVRAWAERAERLREGAGEIAQVEAGSLAAWARFTAGDAMGDTARALEVRAARLGLADVVVDLAALSALSALGAHDLEAATKAARRASRMARTEALPQSEYLAHLVLARVRRFEGRPHLCTRIATALARVAPPAFRGWLALELALAGALYDASAARAGGTGCGLDAASSILDALGACAAGQRGGLEVGLERARSALAGFGGLAQELEPLAIAVDPSHPVPAAGALADFLLGRTDAAPGPLAGLLAVPRAGEPAGAVRVVAGLGTPRRVLGLGLGLAPTPIEELGRQSGARQHRRESMLAVLALAGEAGLLREELFRAVWGFAFAPHLHQGVLDVALHRMRGALGSAAELVRTSTDRLVLRPLRPFAVTDPRVERPLDDRVLSLVAARGGTRARELAGDLDVPLRTVQAALARLEEDGACVREGDGARVSYRVEDTTFREPTRPR